MGRPALALLALLAIFSGADAKKTKKLSAAEREERRAKGELLMNAVNLGDREEVERLIEEGLPAQALACQSRPPSPRDDIISSLWCMPELARALTRP